MGPTSAIGSSRSLARPGPGADGPAGPLAAPAPECASGRRAAIPALLVLGVLAWAGAGLGCGEAPVVHRDAQSEAEPPSPMPSATLILGGAESDGSGFLPFEGVQTLVPGAQGGFHIWLKFRVSGVKPGTVKVTREVRRVSDGHLVLQIAGNVDVGLPNDQGYWELPQPLPSFMCPSPIGVNLDGAQVHFLVTLEGPDGTLLAGSEAEVTAVCPTGDQADFCHRICTG